MHRTTKTIVIMEVIIYSQLNLLDEGVIQRCGLFYTLRINDEPWSGEIVCLSMIQHWSLGVTEKLYYVWELK